MSFPRYPTYKASGMDWLDEVPEHWGAGSLRWLARRYSGGTPDKTNRAYWEDGTIPWLNSGAVNDRVIKEPSTYITADAFANSSAKWIPEGALVMALAGQGKTKGMVARLAIRTTCNQSMAAILPGTEVSGPFLYWWLDSNYQNIRNMAGGDLRDGLNLELLGSIQCPIPALAVQDQIAAFLDRETAKIDALVTEQQRLIDLLKEKRQAVISHAVTKGLNPHAPMEPSGVEWLGNVPAHWEVMRLKQLARTLTDGEHISPTLSEQGIPLLSAKDIRDWRIDYDVDKYVSVDDANLFWNRCRPEQGDVLVVSRGATVGRIGVVEKDVAFCLMGSVILCKPRKEYESAFLYYALNAKHSQTSLRFSSASSAQQAIYIRDVAEVPLPVPPPPERAAIVTFLTTEIVGFDALTAEAQGAIDLLQERRTALISAAVTGKIDVRSLEPIPRPHERNTKNDSDFSTGR